LHVALSFASLSCIIIVLPFLLQGLVGAPECGDVVKLQIQVDDNGNIVESKFKTFACGSANASLQVPSLHNGVRARAWMKLYQSRTLILLRT
jgi:hypothetical protein